MPWRKSEVGMPVGCRKVTVDREQTSNNDKRKPNASRSAMHPEQPRTSLAPQRRRADFARQGALSSGPPQGFIQSARRPSFWFPLPRVHAADAAAVEPAQMRSSSSTSPDPALVPSTRTTPCNIGKPELPDTGWDRLKELFERDATQRYPEEVNSVIKSGMVAALAGMIYGGLPAARHARQAYIEASQAQMYTSQVDAARSAHNAAVRGFVRYGWRWSWRVAAFVTVFNSVSTGLSVYRDKNVLSHYCAAGAVTGGLFRLNLGLRGLVAGTVIGAVLGSSSFSRWLHAITALLLLSAPLSARWTRHVERFMCAKYARIPTGAVIIGMQSLAGETDRKKRRRERREIYELKLAEWTSRLQLTDDLIGDLDVSSQAEEAKKDVERIQELLSLPPNEAAPQDSSGEPR